MAAEADSPLLPKLGANGLPEISEEQGQAGYSKGLMMISAFVLIPRVICSGVSVVIYMFGNKALYNNHIDTVSAGQWGYLYIGVGVFSLLVSWLNMWPAAVKAKVMLQNSGNLRANMFIYKVNLPDTEKALPYVVMEEKGAVGEYNRANRSLFHFNENVANVLLNICFAGFVFPFPTMICIIIFAIGRVLHQHGYATGGYGKHGAGFAIGLLSSTVLEGFVWIVAVQSLK